MSSITIGADPEFFIKHEISGTFKSAIDRIGGSKDEPKPLGRPGFFVQEDNVAVEFNIPPAGDAKQFAESIQWAVNKISNDIKSQNLQVALNASVFFEASELDDPRTQVFGCDPDYNAWTGKINPRPYSDLKTLRSCGGHVHIGYVNHNETKNQEIIKAMDLFLGVPSVLLDLDVNRKRLYGKAGAYRSQPWGVEYRVLSNFWLQHSNLMEWVYNQSVKAYESTEKALNLEELQALGPVIQRCINTNDLTAAHKLIDHWNLEMPNV